MDDATLALLRTAACAVADIAFAALIGSLAAAALLHDARSAWAERRARSARTACAVAGGVALAASLAWMAVQVLAMTELAPREALAAAGDVITGTQFGRAWMPGAAALLVATALAIRWRKRPSRRFGAVVGVLAAIVAASRASAGHAGANGFDLQTAVMTVHLLATGAWAGAVMVAAGSMLREGVPARDDDPADAVRTLARLSTLATAALALVVLTGAASAWHALGGHPGVLLPRSANASGASSAWVLALDVKLGLVAVAVALGGVNRLALPPLVAALASTPTSAAPAWRRFAWVLRVESLVLLAVLVAAAVLANGEPPAV